MTQTSCLLGYRQDTLLGPEAIRRALAVLRTNFRIQKISSVYKRYFSEKSEDLNSELILVLKAETDLEPKELTQKLGSLLVKAVEAAYSDDKKNNKTTELVLLSYDQLVLLLPESPLPHPRLVQDPALLRCASEAWGSFNHPVLNQRLDEAVKAVHSFEHIEFYSQGEPFL